MIWCETLSGKGNIRFHLNHSGPGISITNTRPVGSPLLNHLPYLGLYFISTDTVIIFWKMAGVVLEIQYSSSFSCSLTPNTSSLLHLILRMLLLVITPTCLPNDIDGKTASPCLAHREDVDQQIKTWRNGLDVLGLTYINPIIEWLRWLCVAQAQVLADREQQAIDLNTTACQKELIASFRVSLPWFLGPSRSPLPFSPSVQISWREFSVLC